ncbi:5-dehydro-4-deoxy-D-glucuronate isomerase [Priestia endophytica]|jgi:4-deoxy-L-threo-5-hexosulose-uronate ketol-isomerase|uniref:4-deoxy-L-threo-5-hexosulose-uronate ketol-isomerase n=2 Tax=Priestia endophytica TaxID=135735 RepID=A0AAX1Q3P8_9BACI|nr:5-dehydro-4-deoxy-D-glucuronate isomerase [Priestia endophytica]KAB2495560.1 5-dehydro-4-deoxy-D-glucuronate isomerase [Priestia endophytica]KYG27810.1 5-keto-4-deoxyuronate isomerase [Priestia endophytica]MBG9814168.1 5-keto-4-deoxyuronate isomerase [Priestia endophytica]MCM3537380.1 5-dehydro-4-deoxy-D-glucuronate isomerase [Priestia endophytica]RAS73265.1 5-dehydro-4-deoxy-D-glucuronate isomerase [Priestia endophytica]
METRYAHHPEDVKHQTTEELRKNFLVETLFEKDRVHLTYTHNDRMIFGGVTPGTEELTIQLDKELGVNYFLERRELGIINIGDEGTVILDGVEYEMKGRDGLYVGRGTKDVRFRSKDANKPAKFYINSTPAHHTYPTVKIDIKEIDPLHKGEQATLNERNIYQYIHPNVCESCQLQMGLTMLSPGSVWNTMPCHTHERRMEVYLYFDMEPDTRVFHFMGKPDETRHLVMKNEQATISPSWSIHTGTATSNYTFIWGMCGENITYDDMDHVEMEDLR